MYEKKIPKDFDCGMAVLTEIIGGKWKPYLLHLIDKGTRRPNELQKAIPTASRRVLDLQLRELEFHGIIVRKIYTQIPLKVEYYLTEIGESILPVIKAMDNWGLEYLDDFKLIIENKRIQLTQTV